MVSLFYLNKITSFQNTIQQTIKNIFIKCKFIAFDQCFNSIAIDAANANLTFFCLTKVGIVTQEFFSQHA